MPGLDDFDRYVARTRHPARAPTGRPSLWIAEKTGGPVPRFAKVEREPPADGS